MIDELSYNSLAPVTADYAQQPAQQPAQTTTNPDPVQAASDLLEVGSQWGRDDYDARARAFGDAIQNGDDAYREQLVAEILRQDPNALNSWMTPERINGPVDSAQISRTSRSDMAEAIAGAYNDGLLPSTEMRNAQGDVIGTESALDTYLYNRNSTSNDPVDNTVEHARNLREFAEFFGGPHYNAEISAFRENFSAHLISDYALNDGITDGDLRNRAAVQAATLLNGDATRGDIAANVLNGLDDGEVKAFMERVANGSELVSTGHLEGLVPNSTVAYRDGLQVTDLALPDQFSGLLSQIARTDTQAAREVATELARLPAQSGELFEDNRSYGYQERVDALGQLFINHSEPILDSLTEYNQDKIGDTDNPDAKQYMRDAADLGSLLNVVLFNEDATTSATARSEILDYAADLKQQINAPESDREALGLLSMLTAAADDAITQGFEGLAADEQAQQELVSFIVDVALAGLPLDKLKSGVADVLGEVFDNPHVTEALKGISGELIDAGTGRLTDAAKEALTEALGADEAELIDQQGASNALPRALVAGIDNDDRAFAVSNAAETIAIGINV